MKHFPNLTWMDMALGPEKLFIKLRKEAFYKGFTMGILVGMCLCYIFMELQ